jgi:protein O-mannosyl-transferase
VIVVMTALALVLLRRKPYIAVGWFWFLGTLVPAIGLVQVGMQSIADRYMYVPMIGLAIIIAWGCADLVRKMPALRWPLTVAAAVAMIAYAILTQRQMRRWQNNITIGQHTLAVTSDDNAFAHSMISTGYYERNDLEQALLHAEIADRLHPGPFKANLEELRQLKAQRDGQTDR